MEPFDEGNGITDLAWMMFAANGNPGFYMLYNDLLGDGENENRANDERLR